MTGDDMSRYRGWQPILFEDRCRARLDQLDAAANELIAVCAGLGNIKSVCVFGSYAKRAVHPDSDLDALIVRDTSLPRVERERDIRLAMKATTGFDLVIVRPDEYDRILPTTSFGRDILRDAVLLATFPSVASPVFF